MPPKAIVKDVAVRLKLDVKSVERLLGSNRVEAQEGEVLDLGLRLLETPIDPEFLASTVERYKQTCPLIVSKIINPEYKAIELVKSASLVSLRHACRTAGRLRATALRRKPI